uniref:Large ribosomal subunit protein uL23c n=1 Tax=Microrhizoidea pickettheapsiorum TaxID=2604950 RepID=A0A5B9RGS8_9CHLO|nr:ribosomal protein L23 [Microrhizoidea pickettheapsiorum]QEG77716.1 ribosomal protein L23 [Microrhizoidea pickettheapsiorum]
MIDGFKYPVMLTEKAAVQMEANKYTFQVDPQLSKKQIKDFIEKHYKVKVIQINTHRPPRKKGSALYKRAIITLNQTLSF